MVSRDLSPGMGEAVARRTILRKHTDGSWETWKGVADRVAAGNASVAYGSSWEWGGGNYAEQLALRDHIASGRVLMSGRHLQHGDTTQPTRHQEVFTNCSTASSSFMLMLLLLQGSGVGRSYADDYMLVDWDNAPDVVCCLSIDHPDFTGNTVTPAEAWNMFDYAQSRDTGAQWFTVPDSREGWAQAIELLEVMAFEGHRDELLVLDFSNVRPMGAPIAGMQNRPSSGPQSLMHAIEQAVEVRGKGMPRWEQAMRVDHALASCVAVGGARRAARMAMKPWTDGGVLEFIGIKQRGGLWSANNSLAVDDEFWCNANVQGQWANIVFEAAVRAQYEHGSGEPGFVNVDKLHCDRTGMEVHISGTSIGNDKYRPMQSTTVLLGATAARIEASAYPMIVNPCGEIPLFAGGGYCVIADVVPFHCDTLVEVQEAFRVATRALMRVNLMPSFYEAEVRRTQRIGVGFTGIHEFAYKFWGLSWADLVVEHQSQAFWAFLEWCRKEIEAEAADYAKELGVRVPHTFTTVKPAGTTSKLFGLTEGAHLPAMRYYLRNVQFQDTDPLVSDYEQRGYPVVRTVPNYPGVAIVGFPTCPTISQVMPAELVVTASEATVEEQFAWLRLIERYWLGSNGNQASYTLKYDKSIVTPDAYRELILANQPTVRCCSVMPASDWRETQQLYGYVPEQPISAAEYHWLVAAIDAAVETIDLEQLRCDAGVCPL